MIYKSTCLVLWFLLGEQDHNSSRNFLFLKASASSFRLFPRQSTAGGPRSKAKFWLMLHPSPASWPCSSPHQPVRGIHHPPIFFFFPWLTWKHEARGPFQFASFSADSPPSDQRGRVSGLAWRPLSLTCPLPAS